MNMGASAIVVHSLHRSGTLIDTQEFENVIGRAGRAFVDIDGLVLHPMYQPNRRRRRDWQKLIAGVGQRQLRSGLLALVEALLEKLHLHVGGELEDLQQYVLGQTVPLSIHPNEADEDLIGEWPVALELLDEALLATIDPLDCEQVALPVILDEVLRGSLWARWLGDEPEPKQFLYRHALITRSSWIWANNSVTDRRGYYAAGLGVSSGQYLRDNADRLYELLVKAEIAIKASDDEHACKSIAELHEIVSAVRPFAPSDPRNDTSEILVAWLNGTSVADLITTFGEGTQDFVEDAFVYRLTWAMEAVRTTAVAREHRSGDVIEGGAAAAVAAGLLDPRGILMLQVGMESRLCALAAIAENPGTFSSIVELRAWVDSCPGGPDWPTDNLAWAWTSFVNRLGESRSGVLIRREGEIDAVWEAEPPTPGTLVRIAPGDLTVRDAATRIAGHLANQRPSATHSVIDAQVVGGGGAVAYETYEQSMPA